METKKTGGPAFPTKLYVYDGMTQEWEVKDVIPGMTLRDYFASQASEADIVEHQKNIKEGYSMSRERARYEYADAMIRERDK